MAGLHSTAGPCCSPRKMAPINMLYLDQVMLSPVRVQMKIISIQRMHSCCFVLQDYNVILGKLPSMKVQKCGCK